MIGEELFGFVCQDVITGFKGVVMGYCKYYTGCDQYLLVPKSQDNKPGTGQWFDDVRIRLLPGEDRVELVDTNAEKPGGCEPAPTK